MNKQQTIFDFNKSLFVSIKMWALFALIGTMLSCSAGDDTLSPPIVGDLGIDISASSISTNQITVTWTGEHEYSHFVLLQDGTKIDDNIAGTNTAGENIESISYTVSNLSPNKEYKFSLKVCIEIICSVKTVDLTPTTRPNSPEEFNFVKDESTYPDLTLAWEAPTLGGANHYDLYRGTEAVEKDIQTLKQVVKIDGLPANSEHTFGLVACNENGLCSTTNKQAITTPPAAPAKLDTKNVESTRATILWEKTEGTTSYVVTKQKEGDVTPEVVDNTLDDTATELIIGGLTPETGYTFAIQACNDMTCSQVVKTGLVNTKEIPNVKPDPPTGLVAKVSSTTVELDWNDVANTLTYNVVYSHNGAEVTNEVTTSEASLANLNANTEYTFSVEACNNTGCSAKSPLTLTTAPDTPGGFSATSAPGKIDLTWVVSAGATHYVIDTGSVKITNNDGTSTSQAITTGLSSATTYTLNLVACNASGCSPEATTTTTTPPDAPENFAAGTVTSTSVALSWDQVVKATSYIIHRDGSAVATNTGSTSTTYTVMGLDPNTSHQFSVSACVENSSTCSAATALDSATPPNAPENVAVTKTNAYVLVLEWDATTGASEYVIYRDDVVLATNVGTTYNALYLTPLQSYKFSVKACNTKICSVGADVLVTTKQGAESFTIGYPPTLNSQVSPAMDSTVSAMLTPILVSGKDCDIESYTLDGKAVYTVEPFAVTAGSTTAPTPLKIVAASGVVNNDDAKASPGTFRVKVAVAEKAACNTNTIVYNTVTPDDDLDALRAHRDRGLALYGNTGDYNYIITSKVTRFVSLFATLASFNGDITKWDTSQVTRMDTMFDTAYAFNQPIGNWDISKVNNMQGMFSGSTDPDKPKMSFNQPLSNWNTSSVTTMLGMFGFNTTFNQDISGWQVSQVEKFELMFHNAAAFKGDLSGWDVSGDDVTARPNPSEYVNDIFRGSGIFNDQSLWPRAWKNY